MAARSGPESEQRRGLDEALEIAGSASARELRVDEARLTTKRGRTTTRRIGLPSEGAALGVIYRDVQVVVSVQGQSERTVSSVPTEPRLNRLRRGGAGQ